MTPCKHCQNPVYKLSGTVCHECERERRKVYMREYNRKNRDRLVAYARQWARDRRWLDGTGSYDGEYITEG
jgi:hypothetical protein